VDATTIRLPELALGESWVLHAGLAGRTLELLRAPEILEPVTARWIQNPLVAPVAALPLQDGLTALVLEETGRLREIELATGVIVREVAAGFGGIPSALALERGEAGVLVATDLGGISRIERVELASGAATELVAADGSVQGPVRGLASLGTEAFVFTAGTALHFVDTRDPPGTRVAVLVSDLAEPRGIVVDPLPPHRVYLAERGADRVLAVDLDSHGGMPVAVRTDDLAPAELLRPSALGLERRGSRLLAVTEPVPGSLQLVALELGADGRNVVREIGSSLPGMTASLASGEEDLRLLMVEGQAELHVAGGIEQRREIAAVPAYDPATQGVSVTESFRAVAAARPALADRRSRALAHLPRGSRARSCGIRAPTSPAGARPYCAPLPGTPRPAWPWKARRRSH
jgi:hypothetical protein